MIQSKRLAEIMAQFQGKAILVFGDIILDRYIFGRVNRISPEAPVPVLRVDREEFRLGGAGNVCANLDSLGARGVLLGLLGNDLHADKIIELKEMDNLAIRHPSFSTMVKTRVMAQKQQVVRIDREAPIPIDQPLEARLLQTAAKLPVDAIIVSDYGKGTVTANIMRGLRQKARRERIPLIVDPKPPHFHLYSHVDGITPNLMEAEAMIRRPISEDPAAAAAAKQIREKYGTRFTVITRGDRGITASEKGRRTFHIPAASHEVFDVTGAGDTVVAVLTLSLAAGCDLREAATLANAAASLVIEKIGTSQTTIPELSDRIRSS